MHVDDFIDYSPTDEYASWFFMLKRLPASLSFKFEEFIKQYKLFCKYDSKKYRVTGASRMGDIWLTSDFSQESGYELRVEAEKCSDWSKD